MNQKVVFVDPARCQLSVECGKCGTAVVFDFSKGDRLRPFAQCPGCGLPAYNPHDGPDPPEMFRQFVEAVKPTLAMKDGQPVPTFAVKLVVLSDED